jgi:hypothetical protein
MSAAKVGRTQQAEFGRQADLREQKAVFDSAQARNKFERVRGQQAAAIGATGLDPSSFSDLLADSVMESELEVKAIKFQGAQEAYNLRTQGAAARQSGDAAQVASYFSAAGTVASGGAKIAAGPTFQSTAIGPWRTSVQYGA